MILLDYRLPKAIYKAKASPYDLSVYLVIICAAKGAGEVRVSYQEMISVLGISKRKAQDSVAFLAQKGLIGIERGIDPVSMRPAPNLYRIAQLAPNGDALPLPSTKQPDLPSTPIHQTPKHSAVEVTVEKQKRPRRQPPAPTEVEASPSEVAVGILPPEYKANPEFCAYWEKWALHRSKAKGSKKKLLQDSLEYDFGKLLKYIKSHSLTPKEAGEFILSFSYSKGYQGLFLDESALKLERSTSARRPSEALSLLDSYVNETPLQGSGYVMLELEGS